LAHELGHILNLRHIPAEKSRLMYQGANGFDLTHEEVDKARAKANTF
jgi:Zn-dependent peptidase ImmA (M78 family)